MTLTPNGMSPPTECIEYIQPFLYQGHAMFVIGAIVGAFILWEYLKSRKMVIKKQ